jgi:hypothetical protein
MTATAKQPFIPRDKPKSFVIFTVAALAGLGVGLLAFAFAWFGFNAAYVFATALFVVCWVVGALFLLLFAVQSVAGEYKDLQPKPWREQKW